MNTLASYIAKSETTQSALAAAIGVSRGYMSQLAAGLKTPSLPIALAIEAQTQGAVPAQSWAAQPQAGAV